MSEPKKLSVQLATPQGLLEHASDFAGQAFAETGEVQQMFLAVKTTGEVMVIATSFVGETREEVDDAKDAICETLRGMFREHKVERYAMMGEIWMIEVDKRHGPMPGQPGFVPPSQSDRRVEAVHVLVVDRDGTALSTIRKIDRDDGGARLGPPEALAMGPIASGRFTELLQ